MHKVHRLLCYCQWIVHKVNLFDGLAPLLIRLYLAPVFWLAGMQKWQHMESTIAWFANPIWGFGFAFPTVLAYFLAVLEVAGAISLLLGLAVRWFSIPLLVTILSVGLLAPWNNGWHAVTQSHALVGQHHGQNFLMWLENTPLAQQPYITALSKPAILQNGVEFSVVYFILLFTLFFIGAGRYVSCDYWLMRGYRQKLSLQWRA